MLKIKNLKQIDDSSFQFDYSCDGGEWGECILNQSNGICDILKYAENDSKQSTFYKNHFYDVVNKALRNKKTEATCMWY